METMTFPTPPLPTTFLADDLEDGHGRIVATAYGHILMVRLYVSGIVPSSEYTPLYTDARLGVATNESQYFCMDGSGSSASDAGFMKILVTHTGKISIRASGANTFDNMIITMTYIGATDSGSS